MGRLCGPGFAASTAKFGLPGKFTGQTSLKRLGGGVVGLSVPGTT